MVTKSIEERLNKVNKLVIKEIEIGDKIVLRYLEEALTGIEIVLKSYIKKRVLDKLEGK